MLYPVVFGDVLAFQDKLTECVGAGVALPESATEIVEGCALLLKLRVAVAVPVTKGLNVT